MLYYLVASLVCICKQIYNSITMGRINMFEGQHAVLPPPPILFLSYLIHNNLQSLYHQDGAHMCIFFIIQTFRIHKFDLRKQEGIY